MSRLLLHFLNFIKSQEINAGAFNRGKTLTPANLFAKYYNKFKTITAIKLVFCLIDSFNYGHKNDTANFNK